MALGLKVCLGPRSTLHGCSVGLSLWKVRGNSYSEKSKFLKEHTYRNLNSHEPHDSFNYNSHTFLGVPEVSVRNSEVEE